MKAIYKWWSCLAGHNMIHFGGIHEDTLSLTHTLLRSSPEKYLHPWFPWLTWRCSWRGFGHYPKAISFANHGMSWNVMECHGSLGCWQTHRPRHLHRPRRAVAAGAFTEGRWLSSTFGSISNLEIQEVSMSFLFTLWQDSDISSLTPLLHNEQHLY